jgi:hypothetical protein
MIIDTLFMIIIAGLFITFFALFYFHAEVIYNHQNHLRNDNKILFKIFGQNEKYLDDKLKWIKHFRIYISLIFILVMSILIPFFFVIS